LYCVCDLRPCALLEVNSRSSGISRPAPTGFLAPHLRSPRLVSARDGIFFLYFLVGPFDQFTCGPKSDFRRRRQVTICRMRLLAFAIIPEFWPRLVVLLSRYVFLDRQRRTRQYHSAGLANASAPPVLLFLYCRWLRLLRKPSRGPRPPFCRSRHFSSFERYSAFDLLSATLTFSFPMCGRVLSALKPAIVRRTARPQQTSGTYKFPPGEAARRAR